MVGEIGMMKTASMIAASLTLPQRDMMIDHVDKPVDVVQHDSARSQTRQNLVKRGLLRGNPPNTARPQHTILTPLGREVVAHVLGAYADALARAGMIEIEIARMADPTTILAELKARRQAGDSHTNPAKSPNLKISTKPASSDSDMGR